jgi:hypothetical protein
VLRPAISRRRTTSSWFWLVGCPERRGKTAERTRASPM